MSSVFAISFAAAANAAGPGFTGWDVSTLYPLEPRPQPSAFVITMKWHGRVASSGDGNGSVPDSAYPSRR